MITDPGEVQWRIQGPDDGGGRSFMAPPATRGAGGSKRRARVETPRRVENRDESGGQGGRNSATKDGHHKAGILDYRGLGPRRALLREGDHGGGPVTAAEVKKK